MEQIEKSAGSVEEAVEAALAELGISEQEAHIEVVQEPRSGFLGLKSQQAVVRVRRHTPEGRAGSAARGEEEPSEAVDPEVEEQADAAADFLDGLLEGMGLSAEVEIHTDHGITYVEVWGAEDAEDMGLLIGKRGATLDALQELVRTVVHRQTGERCRVVVDVEDYRKRRRAQIVRRAREVARKVSKTGRPEALDPMSPFDRKIVHDTVAEVPGLETASEGVEPNRRVVVRRTAG